jgi:sigma-B regulation protein RsbU (phosphoserine phosphatase)
MKAKVLLIDDDKVTLTMLEMILSRHDYLVLLAEDGEKGLEIASSQMPQAVICDMLIPKLHGLELCQKIKLDPRLSGTKVILMTAVYKGTAFKNEAKRCGADHFFEKPINTNELLALLKKLLTPPSE